jgi:hypothetical protein
VIVGFVPLDETPLVILHLHEVCNQRCPYCFVERGADPGFGKIGEPQWREALVRFFADRGPFQILLTGGEPLITPGLSEMIGTLAAQGHRIGLQSNLRVGAELFMQAVAPEQTSYIVTTFHSVALDRLRSYLRVVKEMKSRGYPIVVKLLLDEVMLEEFPRVGDAFAQEGIGVFLAPRVFFPRGEDAYPQAYSAAQWARIAPRMTLAASWLYFAGGWRSRGRPCPAGQRIFHARATRGTIHGCAHSFPLDLGDLYANVLTPLHEMVACGLDQCVCDFHTYVGLTPGVDDSARFRQLLSGPGEPVPFAEYLAFIERADITPLMDLRPVIAEAGAWDGEAASCRPQGGGRL